jgi:plasmid stability protein
MEADRRKEGMATLNIKNVPDSLYKKLQARARRLHRSVAQEVIHLLSGAQEQPEPLSVMELRGLGKELWKDVDAAGVCWRGAGRSLARETT